LLVLVLTALIVFNKQGSSGKKEVMVNSKRNGRPDR
jgi:hypothetical protein